MTAVSADDRVRFCGHCQKNVYNVAALAPEEALDLIDRSEGGLCMRLSRRPDGTLVTGDCRAHLRYARRRGRLPFLCALVAVFAVQLWTQAFGLRALRGLVSRPIAPTRTALGAMEAPPPVMQFAGEVSEPEMIMAGGIRPAPADDKRRK